MRQIHHQKVDLLFNTAYHGKRFTKVSLSVAGRMRQWNKHLLLTLLGSENVVLHDRDTANKVMIIAKPLKDAL